MPILLDSVRLLAESVGYCVSTLKKRVAALVLGAGKSTRMKKKRNKVFLPLGGKPVFLHSVDFFRGRREIVEIVLVVAPNELDYVRRRFGRQLRERDVVLAAGGRRRQDSARNGFSAVRGEVDIVLVHDAARPFPDGASYRRVISVLERTDVDGVVPVMGIPDTIRRIRRGILLPEVPVRDEFVRIQTPQAFSTGALSKGFDYMKRKRLSVTDDAQMVERAGMRVVAVAGSELSFKITTDEDYRIAAAVVSAGSGI